MSQEPQQTLSEINPVGVRSPCSFKEVQEALQRLQRNLTEVNNATNFHAFLKANMSWAANLPVTNTTNDGSTALFLVWNPNNQQIQVIAGANVSNLLNTGSSGTDEQVKVSSNDNAADYLVNKVVADGASTMTVAEIGDPGDEDLELSSGITAQAVTDSTGGNSSSTVNDVGATYSQSTLNDNFATIVQKLKDAGVWT